MDEMMFGHLSQAREPSTSPFLLRICDSVTLRDERSPHSDLGHPVLIAVDSKDCVSAAASVALSSPLRRTAAIDSIVAC
jgi:hypothetical protein